MSFALCLKVLESAFIDWLPFFCEFTVERIAGSRGVLDYPPRHIFPFGMRLDKSVDNSGCGGILPDPLIDGIGALFVCEFDLNVFHASTPKIRW